MKYQDIRNITKVNKNWDQKIENEVFQHRYKKDLEYNSSKNYQVIIPLLELNKYKYYTINIAQFMHLKLRR